MDDVRHLPLNVLVKCRTGSHAYGMATPTSDLDIRGVFAADRLDVLTPFAREDEYEVEGADEKYFELAKYVRLVVDQNPNIVELLWVDPSDVLYETLAWRLLREARGDLLSRRLRWTYAGYAKQEIQKMKSHTKWLNAPQPEEPPKPMDFVGMVHNLGLGPEFNKRVPTEGSWTAVSCGKDLFLLLPGGTGSWFDRSGALRTYTREEARSALDAGRPVAIIKFNRAEYEARKKNHENYWTWRRNRNRARGVLEEQLGYDAKNGAHLIRLMRTACEAMTEGVIRVRRPDAEELLAIRRGEWSYERLMAEVDVIEARLAEAEKSTSLPETLDKRMVGEIVMRMYEAAWSGADRKADATGARAAAGQSASRSGADASIVPGAAPDLRGRVIAVDVEGTGYIGDEARAVELAAVEIVGGVRTGRVFHAYVDPHAPVSPYATRVHGLTAAFLAGKPTFAEVAPAFLEFLGESPIVMHDAAGDLKVLNHDLALAGLPVLDAARVTCSLRMGRQLFPGTTLSLDALCDTFGVDRTARNRGHSAIVDATLLSECLLRMAEMPAYGKLRNVGLLARAARAFSEAGRTTTARAAVALSPDGRTVRFTFEDGREVEGAVPDYPHDTHELRVHPSGALLVLPKAPGAADEAVRPDNPLGPAVVTCRGGGLHGVWMRDGVGVRTADLASDDGWNANDQLLDTGTTASLPSAR